MKNCLVSSNDTIKIYIQYIERQNLMYCTFISQTANYRDDELIREIYDEGGEGGRRGR